MTCDYLYYYLSVTSIEGGREEGRDHHMTCDLQTFRLAVRET